MSELRDDDDPRNEVSFLFGSNWKPRTVARSCFLPAVPSAYSKRQRFLSALRWKANWSRTADADDLPEVYETVSGEFGCVPVVRGE
jgi:hypothetical protein